MIILYAIPVFMLLIVLEALVDWRKATGYYRFNDAVGSLSTGMLNRTMDFVTLYVNWAAYSTLFAYFSFFQLEQSAIIWVVAFIVYDFFYYWSHRLDHVFSIFWNAHAVHHQSEEFNLTTALRQPFSGFVKGSLVYMPMVFLGFDPALVATVGSFNLIYQFWVHTRFVPKLGFVEWIMVTPSNHRVHHGMNDRYIDKNFGGVFILWDRLFGTFQEELSDDPVVFGVRKPLNSFNPFYANFQIYRQMLKDMWVGRSLRTTIEVLISRTGVRPAIVNERAPMPRLNLQNFRPYNPSCSTSGRWLVWSQLLFALGYTVWFLLSIDLHNFTVALLHFLPLGLVLLSMNFILEGRPLGWWIELFRLMCISLIGIWVPVLWPENISVLYVVAAGIFWGFCFLFQKRNLTVVSESNT